MKRLTVITFLVVGLIGCRSTPINVVPGPARSAPEGYVVTPHGLVHRSCVREIEPGERVDAQGVVTHANGGREQLPRCQYARLNLHTLQPIVAGSGVQPTVNGWVEATDWTTSSALGSLSATFPVPPAPASNGATIFFFPGSEPSDGSTIIQPVLQYGPSAAGGGNYWTAGSWFCCPSGYSNFSPLITVSSGDTISGTMTSTCSGSSCNWNVVTKDVTSNAASSLPADNVTTPFVWDFGGVLEAYQVSACTQYPAGGSIAFTGIALQDQSGNPLQPSWHNWVIGGTTPTCGYTVQSTPATATLTY